MVSTAAIFSDSLKGVLTLVMMGLLVLQMYENKENHQSKKLIHRSSLGALLTLFLAFLGHRDPLVFPWQMVAFFYVVANLSVTLILLYVVKLVMMANYTAANLKKKTFPERYHMLFKIIGIFHSVFSLISVVTAIALNRLSFFAIRMISTALVCTFLGIFFLYHMINLYKTAYAIMSSQWEMTSSHRSHRREGTDDVASPRVSPPDADDNSRSSRGLLLEGKDEKGESKEPSSSVLGSTSGRGSARVPNGASHGSKYNLANNEGGGNTSPTPRHKFQGGAKAANPGTRQKAAFSAVTVETPRGTKADQKNSGTPRFKGTRQNRSSTRRMNASMRKTQRKKKNMMVLNKIRLTIICAGVIFFIAAPISTVMAIIWGTSTMTLSEYYDSSGYDVGGDVIVYVILAGNCFNVYYSWIMWPRSVQECCKKCWTCGKKNDEYDMA
ncbi:hypothetical protein AAMO2058_000648100 [Amorphochlora amoebiformis]